MVTDGVRGNTFSKWQTITMEHKDEIWSFVDTYLEDAKPEEKVTLSNEFQALFDNLYQQFCEQLRFDKSCQNDRVKGQNNNQNI